MKSNSSLTHLLEFTKRHKKLFLIALVGLANGIGLLLWFETADPYKKDLSMFLWAILLSSIIWLVMSFLMRPIILLIFSGIYYAVVLTYWIYYEDQTGVGKVVIGDNTLVACFIFIGLLIAVMSFINYYLFSKYSITVTVISFFQLFFMNTVLPSMLKPGTDLHLLNLEQSFFTVLLISSAWIIICELLISIIYEFSRKVVAYE